MSLLHMGWSEYWGDFQSTDQHRVARITHKNRGSLVGRGINGTITCLVSGKMEYNAESVGDLPTVGDWCLVGAPFPGSSGEPTVIIERLLPRRTKISRIAPGSKSDEQILAANVDFAFIVTAANLEFNVGRLHRYMYIALQGGVTPVLVLSKTDLSPSHSEFVETMNKSFPTTRVIIASAVTNNGVGDIAQLLKPGITGVFMGSSGVGKSTLTNVLLGGEIQKTSSVRLADDKGRHTTSSGTMFFTNSSAMIIDTPGLREIQIAGVEEDLESLFGDVEEMIRSCRFSNCGHGDEPGCAIQAALANGTIDSDTLKRFHKMRREAEFNLMRTDAAYCRTVKNRWKKLNKDLRARKKLESKR
ncbi:MAG: ribosome small subunit-dependent GTPase A [Oligoflexales bacterium]